MHKYLILFFSASLFLCACKSNEVPKDVLQPDKMVEILTQLHIVDGTLYNGLQAPDSLYKHGTAKYNAVFKQLHTDTGEFRRSMRYYAVDLDRLSAIYDKVDIKIKSKGDSVNTISLKQRKADEDRKADSLKKLKPKKPDALPKK